MKKLYQKNIITIILILLVILFGYLNYSKIITNRKQEVINTKNNFFSNIVTKMKDVKSVTIKVTNTESKAINLEEYDLTKDYVIRTTTEGDKSFINYSIKNNKDYYAISDSNVSKEKFDSSTNYNDYLTILTDIKDYTLKDGIYSLKLIDVSKIPERLWDYKDFKVKLDNNNLVAYINCSNDKGSYNISFSKYNETEVNIPTEVLAKVEE